MQIMPDTATWAAENIPLPDFGLDELDDPTVNVTIAAWYFRFLLDHFHGRVAVSLAAYNAGPGTVQGWLETGVWSGALREVEAIPYGETREYVRPGCASLQALPAPVFQLPSRAPGPTPIRGNTRLGREIYKE